MVIITAITFQGCSFPLGGYFGKAALLQQTGHRRHWNPEASKLCQAPVQVKAGTRAPGSKGQVPGALKTPLWAHMGPPIPLVSRPPRRITEHLGFCLGCERGS